jgi:hypothetical protein
MANDLEAWARTERQFLNEDIRWFKAGAKLTSPSGGDITGNKLEELNRRLEGSTAS